MISSLQYCAESAVDMIVLGAGEHFSTQCIYSQISKLL